jgi:hypothetical protein
MTLSKVDSVSQKLNELRIQNGWDGDRCPTCDNPPEGPHYTKDDRGNLVEGCIDSAHHERAGHVGGYPRWYNRPEARQMRKQELAHLQTMQRGPSSGARPADEGDHWVTLSNRRLVLLDQEGRVKRGLPELFEQVHVRDLSKLGKSVNRTKREEQRCERDVSRRRALKFRTADEAVRSLLHSNPELVDFLERECSHDCSSYRTWMNRGRRGPKPKWNPGDGRFDALQVGLDLKGGRKIASWLEAVYVTVPPSHRWADFEPRLQYLVEATGLSLMLPEEAEQLVDEERGIDHCRSVADERIEDLIARAKKERLGGPRRASDSEVPF